MDGLLYLRPEYRLSGRNPKNREGDALPASLLAHSGGTCPYPTISATALGHPSAEHKDIHDPEWSFDPQVLSPSTSYPADSDGLPLSISTGYHPFTWIDSRRDCYHEYLHPLAVPGMSRGGDHGNPRRRDTCFWRDPAPDFLWRLHERALFTQHPRPPSLTTTCLAKEAKCLSMSVL